MKKEILAKFAKFELSRNATKEVKGGEGPGGGDDPAPTCDCLLGDTKIDCGNNGGSINCRDHNSGGTYTLNCQAPAVCS